MSKLRAYQIAAALGIVLTGPVVELSHQPGEGRHKPLRAMSKYTKKQKKAHKRERMRRKASELSNV